MNRDEKARGYRRTALDLLDYTEFCARNGMAPLLYDVNVFRQRFNLIDKAKVDMGSNSNDVCFRGSRPSQERR